MKFLESLSSGLWLLSLTALSCWAQDPSLKNTTLIDRNIKMYRKPQFTSTYALTQPKVVIADYELIKRDFPETQNLNSNEIDDWLLKNVGMISATQHDKTATSKVNTPIPVNTEKKMLAYRPPTYGRALIVPVFEPSKPQKQIGLMDVKGSGAIDPGQYHHANGVMTLGEAMREYIFENTVRRILHANYAHERIVGSYAVLDPGFDVIHKDGTRDPAGYYVRQAKVRWNSGFARGDDVKRLSWMIESSGIVLEAGNIQVTDDRSLIDFGHYYVDPKKNLLPGEIWGVSPGVTVPDGRWSTSKYDRPWMWSHDFARAWREGRADRQTAQNHVNVFLDSAKPTLEKIKKFAGSCSKLVQELTDP